MTPCELAALHRDCFTEPRPFTAAEFTGFLASSLCFLCVGPNGFALGRAVAGEAELLTLCVHPNARRSGLGRALLMDFETVARKRAATVAHLEVAADNRAALHLYSAQGYCESGRRRGYYRSNDGARIDALLMTKALAGNPPPSARAIDRESTPGRHFSGKSG